MVDTTEVCLIVKDEKKDPDDTVLHFKDVLSKHGIKVAEIIPFKRIKSEYKQFEERRKLCERFDIFLCDSRINVIGQLGKKFVQKHKAPCAIDLTNESKLKAAYDTAIKKSLLVLNSSGSESSVQAGWSSMEEEELSDNIISLVDDLQSVVPSIIPLIKKVAIKSEKSPSFELYVNLCPPPVVKKVISAGKKSKPVVGELSTQVDKNIMVFPSGDVVVKGSSKPSSSSENSSPVKKRNRTRKRKSEKNVNASESDSSPKKATKKGQMLKNPLNGSVNTSPNNAKKDSPSPPVKSPKKKAKASQQKSGPPPVTPTKDEETNPLVWKKGDPSPAVKKGKKNSALAAKEKENPMVWKKENSAPKAKKGSPKMKQKMKAKKAN